MYLNHEKQATNKQTQSTSCLKASGLHGRIGARLDANFMSGLGSARGGQGQVG
jgi:hypothetical protein